MTNLYVAPGHINYAKSARIHLQLMLDLENNTWLFRSLRKKVYLLLDEVTDFGQAFGMIYQLSKQ